MPKIRNALAELAKELGEIAHDLRSDDFYRSRISKAHCIVAELAKVQDEEAALFSMENITADEARRIVRQREANCILKCRAIAEEGEKE